MKRIITSLGMIVFVGALVAGATGAFFSDTETSIGNTFAAGDIDLRIDNTSYVTNMAGELVASPANSWALSDLDDQLFFSFDDVKPGDIGEDTISIHPGSNNAFVCMAADITATPDNGINEPEAEALDVTDGNGGELQNFLNFSFWEDDGDNVYETGEVLLPDLQGPAGTIFDGGWNTIADSANGPALPGGSTSYVGKAWCFGTLTPNGTAQDNAANTTPLTNAGGTGFTCNGAGENNIAQTDGITVDVSFYAVQARNNGQFTCASLPPFVGEGEPVIVWTEDGTRTGGDVAFVEDNERGTVLQLTTINNTDSRVRWNNDSFEFDLDTFTGISFDSKQVSAADAVNGNVTLRLLVDLDGDTNTADVEELTYEPYYNILAHNPLNDASIVPNTWQNWATTLADGKYWGNGGFLGTTPSGGAYATNVTLQQVATAYPNAKVVELSLGMGTYNVNQVVLVDNLIVNGAPVSLEN